MYCQSLALILFAEKLRATKNQGYMTSGNWPCNIWTEYNTDNNNISTLDAKRFKIFILVTWSFYINLCPCVKEIVRQILETNILNSFVFAHVQMQNFNAN